MPSAIPSSSPIHMRKPLTVCLVLWSSMLMLYVNFGAPTRNGVQPIPQRKTLEDDTLSFADRTSVNNLLDNFALANERLTQILQRDYGTDHYPAIFTSMGRSRGRTVIVPPGGVEGSSNSWDRLQARIMMKLIDVLLPSNQQPPPTFVWATGGHSSAAGHGNFYDESYTAVLEKNVRVIFDAVGIQFKGRNYAMGGSDSAPEAAWCNEEIFGTDLDVLVWDYGMTDGRDVTKMAMYCYRAALNPNKPACIALHAGRPSQQPRVSALRQLEQLGASVLISDEAVLESVMDQIPDSQGKSDSDLAQMPPLVRSFKCGGLIESGDPYCGAQKYNKTDCTQRKFMAKWHQGWRFHALHGNLMALFLTELVGDALQYLKETTKSLEELRQDLIREENERYNLLTSSPLPSYFEDLVKERGDLQLEHILKYPNFCHTARVPAEIRHKGILTGGPPGDLFHYDQGVPEGKARDLVNDSEFMWLVQDPTTRQKCDIPLNIDNKDYFYVKGMDGMKKLILPNDAEVAEYGTNKKPIGLIAICLSVCDWGKCPKGDIQVEQYEQKQGTIEVNGQRVTGFTKIGRCSFLRHDQGHYFFPNSASKFEISVSIALHFSFTRIGAFIIF